MNYTKAIREQMIRIATGFDAEGKTKCAAILDKCLHEERKLAATALIKHPTEDLYLSVSRKENPNDHGLPGGKLEDGEIFSQAVCREVLEETGLTAVDPTPIFVREDGEYLVITFGCHFNGEINTKEKGVVEWVDKDKLCSNSSFALYNKELFEQL